MHLCPECVSSNYFVVLGSPRPNLNTFKKINLKPSISYHLHNIEWVKVRCALVVHVLHYQGPGGHFTRDFSIIIEI